VLQVLPALTAELEVTNVNFWTTAAGLRSFPQTIASASTLVAADPAWMSPIICLFHAERRARVHTEGAVHQSSSVSVSATVTDLVMTQPLVTAA
jgi:hypothetical protein